LPQHIKDHIKTFHFKKNKKIIQNSKKIKIKKNLHNPLNFYANILKIKLKIFKNL
jgi:hypothetical protein